MILRRTRVLLLTAFSIGACGSPGTDDGGADASLDGSPIDACLEDADCADDLFCTGERRCDPSGLEADSRGCVSLVPCGTTERCVEATQSCEPAEDCQVPDADGDGFDALACGGADCDDADANRHPGAVEICDTSNVDEDCDPATFGVRDGDGDGFADAACCNDAVDGTPTCGPDCDDASAAVHPSEAESCDGRDNDCDGFIDEEVALTFTIDGDLDGDGSSAVGAETRTGCVAPSGFAASAGDCDDDNPDVASTRPERCITATVDDDCDGMTNEGCACNGSETRSCQLPGACNGSVEMCFEGSWGMCSIMPTLETCNGIDDDCNGSTDEGLTVDCFVDDDNDTYSPNSTVITRCPDPSRPQTGMCPVGTTNRAGIGNDIDCNDVASAISPAATEACNGVDDDCVDGPDNTYECVFGSDPEPCTGSASCGMVSGMRSCQTGSCTWSACLTEGEGPSYPGTCNGCNDDGDADGSVDEGFVCQVGASRSCTVCGNTGGGTQACADGCGGYEACYAATELCNYCEDTETPNFWALERDLAFSNDVVVEPIQDNCPNTWLAGNMVCTGQTVLTEIDDDHSSDSGYAHFRQEYRLPYGELVIRVPARCFHGAMFNAPEHAWTAYVVSRRFTTPTLGFRTLGGLPSSFLNGFAARWYVRQPSGSDTDRLELVGMTGTTRTVLDTTTPGFASHLDESDGVVDQILELRITADDPGTPGMNELHIEAAHGTNRATCDALACGHQFRVGDRVQIGLSVGRNGRSGLNWRAGPGFAGAPTITLSETCPLL